MSVLFFLFISCLTPTTTHPYDVDNDGDGYTEFEGDCNDLNPDVIDDCNGQFHTILLEDVLRRLSEIEE